MMLPHLPAAPAAPALDRGFGGGHAARARAPRPRASEWRHENRLAPMRTLLLTALLCAPRRTPFRLTILRIHVCPLAGLRRPIRRAGRRAAGRCPCRSSPPRCPSCSSTCSSQPTCRRSASSSSWTSTRTGCSTRRSSRPCARTCRRSWRPTPTAKPAAVLPVTPRTVPLTAPRSGKPRLPGPRRPRVRAPPSPPPPLPALPRRLFGLTRVGACRGRCSGSRSGWSRPRPGSTWRTRPARRRPRPRHGAGRRAVQEACGGALPGRGRPRALRPGRQGRLRRAVPPGDA